MSRLLSLLFAFLSFSSVAQVPLVRSQNVFVPGTVQDRWDGTSTPKIMLQARNGNTIIGGTIDSGFRDLYLAEIDSANQVVWSKTYGYNNREDILTSVQEGIGGGYVLLGVATDRGEAAPGVKGGEDAWVVRVNAIGEILWEKYFGGSADDKGNHIERVGNEGYIMVGNTESVDGDLEGVRLLSDTAKRGRIWVTKMDAIGNLVWSRTFGGASEFDVGVMVRTTTDSGFIVGANMASADGHGVSNHGVMDIWLAKLNRNGAPQWFKCYGGSRIEQVSDVEVTGDGYLVSGATLSNDGDVSGFHGDAANNPNLIADGWIFKVSHSAALQWQKCIGGTGNDAITDIVPTPSGDIIGVGNTTSADGDITQLKGNSDVLLFNLASNTTLRWVKTLGGTWDEHGGCIMAPNEEEYIFLGNALSVDGDVVGSPGGERIWLGRLGAGSTVKGFVFYDYNADGVKDANEPAADNIGVTAVKIGFERTTITKNGQFSLTVDNGETTIKIHPEVAYYQSTPQSATVRFDQYFLKDSVTFALQPIPGKKDLQVAAVPLQAARPGFALTYRLNYKNAGTTTIDKGALAFVKDGRIDFINATPAASLIDADTVFWSYENLKPGDSASIYVNLRVKAPPVVNITDTISSFAFITPAAGDETPTDDSVYIRQVVTGSFDPNDKAETHAGIITPTQVTKAEYLNYTIRFQNMGTDTAFNIVVRDTLDAALNWASFEMIAASHPYNLVIKSGNKLAWEFPKILLPDDKKNEPLSHGYISYRIKPRKTLGLGDKIHNKASIYFDYNLPVVTNDALTEVRELAAIALPLTLLQFNGKCSGNTTLLNWTTANESAFSHFVVEGGSDGRFFKNLGLVKASGNGSGRQHYSFDVNFLQTNDSLSFFRLKMFDADGKVRYSPVFYLKCGSEQVNSARLYPNPAQRVPARMEVVVPKTTAAILVISDAYGKQISREKLTLQKGTNLIMLNNFLDVPAGVYWIKLETEVKSWVNQLTVIH